MGNRKIEIGLNNISVGTLRINGNDVSSAVKRIVIEAEPLSRPKVLLECCFDKLEACIDDPELLSALKEGYDLDDQTSNGNKKIFHIPTFLCAFAIILLLFDLLFRLF